MCNNYVCVSDIHNSPLETPWKFAGRVYTYSSKHTCNTRRIVAGGFQGDLICKTPNGIESALDRAGVSFFSRTTYDDNAITNAIEIYNKPSKTAKKKKISTVSPSSQLVQVVPDNQNNTGDSSAKVKYEDRVRKSCLLDLLYGIQIFVLTLAEESPVLFWLFGTTLTSCEEGETQPLETSWKFAGRVYTYSSKHTCNKDDFLVAGGFQVDLICSAGPVSMRTRSPNKIMGC
ncbi:hypothetical protein YC2023_062469 [Brassica napus]